MQIFIQWGHYFNAVGLMLVLLHLLKGLQNLVWMTKVMLKHLSCPLLTGVFVLFWGCWIIVDGGEERFHQIWQYIVDKRVIFKASHWEILVYGIENYICLKSQLGCQRSVRSLLIHYGANSLFLSPLWYQWICFWPLTSVFSTSQNKVIWLLLLTTFLFTICCISHPDLVVPADIECTFPPCTSTAYGWGTCRRSLCCCRSLRKSSCAWRPWFSSASVSIRRGPCEASDVGPPSWGACSLVFKSSSGGTEESEVLWWTTSHLHQRARPHHQLSDGQQLLSEVLPADPTPRLSADGETLQEEKKISWGRIFKIE